MSFLSRLKQCFLYLVCECHAFRSVEPRRPNRPESGTASSELSHAAESGFRVVDSAIAEAHDLVQQEKAANEKRESEERFASTKKVDKEISKLNSELVYAFLAGLSVTMAIAFQIYNIVQSEAPYFVFSWSQVFWDAILLSPLAFALWFAMLIWDEASLFNRCGRPVGRLRIGLATFLLLLVALSWMWVVNRIVLAGSTLKFSCIKVTDEKTLCNGDAMGFSGYSVKYANDRWVFLENSDWSISVPQSQIVAIGDVNNLFDADVQKTSSGSASTKVQ